jgi:hypothetical protein
VDDLVKREGLWIMRVYVAVILLYSQSRCSGRGKGKVYPRTGHEEVYFYSFLNLGAKWGWVVNATLRPLYPRERPGIHCTRGWLGPQGWSGRL